MEVANKILNWICFGCWSSLCIGALTGAFEPSELGYVCATGCLALNYLSDILLAGKK